MFSRCLQRELARLPLYRALTQSLPPELRARAERAFRSQQQEVEILGSLCPPGVHPSGPAEMGADAVAIAQELHRLAEESLLEYQYGLPLLPIAGGQAEAAERGFRDLTAVSAEKAAALHELVAAATGEPGRGEYWLEPGYRLERVIAGLTFPTGLFFDAEGTLHIIEAGFSYGPAKGPARILQLCDGRLRVAIDDLRGPVTGALWHDGCIYVAEGGFPGRITRHSGDGRAELVKGLLTFGDHYTSELVLGPDRRLYFGVGVATNSAVVGMDNFLGGWLPQHPDRHDVPARDVTLAGEDFWDLNWLARDPRKEEVHTGSFKPFGTRARAGEVVKGQLLANGVIYRVNLDGTGLEVVADGFRNVLGLGLDSAGRLLAVNHGFDGRGNRPIENDWDSVWEVVPGGWYGWPDFASGLPVTQARFRPPGQPQPRFVLQKHPTPAGQPLLRLPPHSAGMKFDFSRAAEFGFAGQMFLAQFGHGAPVTAMTLPDTPGFRVVRANLESGQVRDFYVNRRPGKGLTQPERPIAVKFDPAGRCLYLLDFGVLEAVPGNIIPHAGTGALWRITRA